MSDLSVFLHCVLAVALLSLATVGPAAVYALYERNRRNV